MDADAPHGRKDRAHRELAKPQRTRFRTAPTAILFIIFLKNPEEDPVLEPTASTGVEN